MLVCIHSNPYAYILKSCLSLFFLKSLSVLVRIPPLIGGMVYDEEDEEISTDLWQEACWIVIRFG